MEFGGPTPPLDDKYCPSLITEAVWKQIEKNEISYKEDIRGWRQKFEDEKNSIEEFAEQIAPKLSRWLDETDYAIRTLRSVNEDSLAQFYQAQMVEQQVYMNRLEQRRSYLEKQIIEMSEQIAKEEGEKKKEKKREKKERQAAKKASAKQESNSSDLTSDVDKLQAKQETSVSNLTDSVDKIKL